jgi:hypothetical protein
MSSAIAKRLQLALLVVILIAGIRLGLIYRSRHQPATIGDANSPTKLNADDYVVAQRLHASDLTTLRELRGKPVWIRGGYQMTYYAYNPATKHADLNHEAGVLGPIEQIEVKDVIEQPAPGSMEWKSVPSTNIRVRAGGEELLAVFAKNGKSYVFPLGQKRGRDYQIFADDVLYYQDPHQLYQHWPPDIWKAIERHQAHPGMNELQVQFAVGVGTLESDEGGERVLHYANGGKPMRVTFLNGKAQKVEGAS